MKNENIKRVSDVIRKNFSLDTHSLALFRVFTSVILIVDFLFTRLPYFTLFYTDKGLLPLKDLFYNESFWSSTSSLNFIFSNCIYQAVLFVLALLCFFMLFIGYKTRWAVLGSWIFLVSFHSRNFLILNSGDTLLCLMLFWALYLPLNRHFSIDSAMQKEQKGQFVFSVNSFAFIFQILFVYYFTYLLKTDAIWKNGQGVYYALMLHDFRTVWGDLLLPYPGVMQILSYVTYYFIENLVPFLFVFFGFWWRFKVIIILLMCGFHLSLGLFLHLGLFSWICIAGWLALLPSDFWKKIKEFLPGRKKPLNVYYDGECSFCKKSITLIKSFLILPHVSFAEAQSQKEALSEMEKRNSWLVFNDEIGWQSRWQAGATLISYSPLFFYLKPLLKLKIISIIGDWFYGQVAKNRITLGYFLPQFDVKKKRNSKLLHILLSAFFFSCFIYTVMWNVRTIDFKYYSKYMPVEWNKPGAFLHLYQYWNMFAPKPLDHSGWIILSAVRSDTNEKIDLWRQGKPVTMEKPHRYDRTFPIFRFRKMMENLVLEYQKYSKNYLTYLCDKWNKETDKPVHHIEFIYMRYKVPPPGKEIPEPERALIRSHNCHIK